LIQVEVLSKELSVHLGSYPGSGEGDRAAEAPGTKVRYRRASKRAGRNASEARAGLERINRGRRASHMKAKAAGAGWSNRPMKSGPSAGVMGVACAHSTRRNVGDLPQCLSERRQRAYRVRLRQESEGLIVLGARESRVHGEGALVRGARMGAQRGGLV